MERFELEVVLVLVVDVEDEELEDVDVDLSTANTTQAKLHSRESMRSKALVAGGCLYLTLSNCMGRKQSLESI